MKCKQIFKMVSVFLAIAIMTVGFSGCGESKKAVKSDEVPEISVYIPGFNMANAQCIVDEINKKANINLDIIESGGNNSASERAALMITTGEKVNWVNIGISQPYKAWGTEGFLNDLAPYLKKYKDELPTLNFIANDDIFKALKGDNGEIYAIPAINYITNQGLRMNREWVESTGVKVPETTAEMLDVMRQFKKEKYEKAGQGSSAFIAGSLADFNWVFLAYGGSLSKNGYPRYYEENGQFYPYDISPMNKEALKYIRTMHQEGLVNSDWQVLSKTSQVKNRFLAGKAGMWYSASGIDEQLYSSIGTTTIWPPAPEGPTGIRSYGGEAPMWMMNVIPASIKDEKDIYNTLKFIEWMHSKEARKLCAFGIEGRHYELTPDGQFDSSKYKENTDNDFARVNGGNSPFEWGWVSPFLGAIDPKKYDNVSDAIANIEFMKRVPKQPVDENYSGYIANINKYLNPYPYSAYYNDDLLFAANTTNEFVSNFYSAAITEKDFDIDAQWDDYTQEYLKQNMGQECLDLFIEMVKKYNK